jgi:hypothetical protein
MTPRYIAVLYGIALAANTVAANAQPDDGQRVRALEQRLATAERHIAELQETIEMLLRHTGEIGGESTAAAASEPAAQVESRSVSVGDQPTQPDAAEFRDKMLVPELGTNERSEPLAVRPELFVQSRYHADPIDEATSDDVTRNFGLNRMELRWAGRVADRIGLGFELQYHPAPDGAPEELVNDAFAEYYVNDAVTIRAGQFVKPFGFDIQHSSGARESPERGIFAGYFFPGQRDRGLMISADLGQLAPRLRGTTVHAGAFNGNRFFNDNNDDLNYNFRVRKVFDALPLAIGASMQIGTQAVPAGGGADEDLYGFDFQYVAGRLGVRGEYARGDMPSTLLGLEPDFAPAFAPGAESWGAVAFFDYNLTANDDIYWRWDRFDNDPVTGEDVRAFNVGYLRSIGANSRVGIDYQRKSKVTFNDDELNTKVSVTWNLAIE